MSERVRNVADKTFMIKCNSCNKKTRNFDKSCDKCGSRDVTARIPKGEK